MMLKATIRKAIRVNYYLWMEINFILELLGCIGIGHVYCDIADVYVNFVIYT